MPKKLKEKEAYNNIIRKCKEISNDLETISFIGWSDGKYKNIYSRLILKNSKTGEVWNSTSYHNFIRNGVKGTREQKIINQMGKETSKRLKSNEVILRIKEINKDKNWNYDKVEYTGFGNPITLVCNEIDPITNKIHGEFNISLNNLLKGQGCPKCSGKHHHSTKEFIELSKATHKYSYDYSKTKYINSKTAVIITCPIHGDFEIYPSNFIYKNQECPKCTNKYYKSGKGVPDSKGEELIEEFLLNNKIDYSSHVKFASSLFSDCPNKKYIEIDFKISILNRNIWVEFNGKQHYEYIELFHEGDLTNYKKQVQRDLSIRNYALENGIEFLEIPYLDIDRIPEILQAFLFEGKDITTKIERDDYSEDF